MLTIFNVTQEQSSWNNNHKKFKFFQFKNNQRWGASNGKDNSPNKGKEDFSNHINEESEALHLKIEQLEQQINQLEGKAEMREKEIYEKNTEI